ncbi:hypothetical protein B8T70_09100 [Flavobacterium sp. AJR]|nr:hypothetical protein B8T70_09100 [Flavobacterium sp. AJR]
MKKNKSGTFRIWFIHILLYYYVYAIIHFSIQNYYSCGNNFTIWSILVLLAYPIAGVLGFFYMFPLFFLLPITIMLVLYKYIYFNQFYKSYLIAILFSHFSHYIFLDMHSPNLYFTAIINSRIKVHKVNNLFFIVPSLIVALSVTWFLFEKYENQKKE